MTASPTVFGIDLGTTYSAIAYVDQYGQPTILLNQENSAVTPSVVYFESPTNVLVGGPARESGRLDPDNYVELVKRDMGDPNFVRYMHGQEYRAEQISSYILKKLMADAEAKLGFPVTDAVITVPAYFNEAERTATENAGKIAGLTVRGIIPEPTAAAIAYAATEAGNQTILVYDLGGGTFDVTVMQVDAGQVRVVCVDGDHRLGGKDWDTQLVSHLSGDWQRAHGSADDPLNDKETLQELSKSAEEAKRNLTTRERSKPVVVKVAHAGKVARVEISRDQFDALTADKLARTVTLTRAVMGEAARQGVHRIDKMLLVGGSVYMPQVQERLAAEFPDIQQQLFEPDQAVAKGAAIYAANRQVQDAYRQALEDYFRQRGQTAPAAATDPTSGAVNVDALAPDVQAEVDRRVKLMLPGRTDDALAAGLAMTVVNACSKSFGIKAMNEKRVAEVAYLIRRNTRVPATQEQEFYTLDDNQTEVEIQVYESGAADPPTDPANLTPIKTETLHLPAGLPAGHPIRVRFSLSDDGGKLRVQATDPTSGRAIDVSVDAMDALMPHEVEAMRQAAAGVSINQ